MTAAYASPAQDPALYDGVADHWWDDSVRWVRTLQAMVPARLRWFEAQGAVWDGLDVLDLGCAGGFMAEALARKGARVSGLDPADAAIAAASAHAAAEGLSIDYRAGVGEALPYADDAFDAVVCVDVLEHVSDLGAVLEEVRRVLRPGGRFCFDTINAGPLPAFAVVTLAENLLGLLPKGAHDPDLFIKPSHLRGALESLGFEVGPFRGLGPVGLNRRLDFVFGTHPLTSIIYIGTAKAPG
ncbi:MAG: bifunctional 2-polyprenyl-6-hydroxyphenol methylase/3-demethylubiquinol 3-O-methyltransferase UbiG [Pseudomonadota bacterium]